MGFDVFSLDAANHAQSANKAANANLDASIIAIQMIKEMRDFNYRRFNDMIDTMRELNVEIQDLKGQVAGLQKRLYELNEGAKMVHRST